MRPSTRHISLMLLLACNGPVDINDDPISDDQACLQSTIDHVDLVVDVPGEDVATVGISNRCDDMPIQIYDVTLDDPTGLWTLDELVLPTTIDPGAVVSVPLSFATSYGVVSEATLNVLTDDAIRPSLQIPLRAVGASPRIALSPSDPVDLGELLIGCESGWDLAIQNVGGAPLTVHNAGLAFLRQGGQGELSATDLPWVIQPGESQDVRVTMHATAEGTDSAYVQLENTDPNESFAVALAAFKATPYLRETSAIKWTGNQVDLLIGLDRTIDARSQQEALLHWLPTITAWGAGNNLDIHVGVISGEDGCVLFGPRWTDETNTTPSELLAMADLDGLHATIGDSEGDLLQRMARATSLDARTGCNSGLLRPGARTHLLLMSDRASEDNDRWNEHLRDLRAPRQHQDDVIVHALTGERGCGQASEGLGSIADATGGAQGRACGDFRDLARPLAAAMSTPILPRLTLEGPAVPGSLEVQVNYREAEHHNWSLLTDPPAVLFTEMTVEPGSILKATYDVVPPEELCR